MFPATPRVISGTSDTLGVTITLASNGVNIPIQAAHPQTTAKIGSTGVTTGFYYFLEGNGAIADGSALLAYISGGSANAVTLAPSAGGSITGFNLTTNTLMWGVPSRKRLPMPIQCLLPQKAA